jgi:hypothetical protein
MIVQIAADARSVEQHGNTELRKLRRRPHTRQHHDLRRADRTGRHDDLTAATGRALNAILLPAHAGGALAIKQQTFDQTAGFQPQILPAQDRFKEPARRRPAPPALLVDVEIAGARVVAGVEVLHRRNAVLRRRLAPDVDDIPANAGKFDAPFTADAVVLARPEKIVFVLLEIRQHVVPRPAGQAELAPVIVVAGLPAHIDHGVDG